MPKRQDASPPTPHKMLSPPPPPCAARAIHSTPNIKRFETSSAVVTGAGPEKTPDRLRFTAAMENLKLVPHWWQRVALMPTNEPQEGQSLGRGCWLPPPKKPCSAAFQRSSRYCH